MLSLPFLRPCCLCCKRPPTYSPGCWNRNLGEHWIRFREIPGRWRWRFSLARSRELGSTCLTRRPSCFRSSWTPDSLASRTRPAKTWGWDSEILGKGTATARAHDWWGRRRQPGYWGQGWDWVGIWSASWTKGWQNCCHSRGKGSPRCPGLLQPRQCYRWIHGAQGPGKKDFI